MPKWGLTGDQRTSEPWGIPKEELRPAKTITDPIHKDIFLTKLEQRVVDSRPLQRLRRVKQLGTTHLVYPGATHNRFSHSLGALRAAQNLLDVVVDHQGGPHPTHDLFEEWRLSTTVEEYNRRVAEATVLTRLGALLHDICHVPFGHSIEDDLGLLDPHDENEDRFERLWSQFDPELQDLISPELKAALRYPLILSKLCEEDRHPATNKYPFVADIVGNTICADLIDYLQRDHVYTGLPAKLGDRFIQGFYVTPSDHKLEPQHMVLKIARDGRERRDVVSELFKYLRYRYELSERALAHHAKLAADAMVGKLLEMWRDALWNDEAARRIPRKVKPFEPDIYALRLRISMKYDQPKLPDQLDREIQDEIESLFLAHGDDGILEHILYSNEDAAKTDRRKLGVVSLTKGLLERQLFKMIGRCSNRAVAVRLYKKFGDPNSDGSRRALRQLEEGAATYAGLDHKWHTLLWIPKPSMRLKAAEVLVDDGKGVSTMLERDKTGTNRGKEIYDAHESLWSLSVYTHASVAEDDIKRKVLLAWLGRELGDIGWETESEQPNLAKLAAAEVARAKELSADEERQLVESAVGLAAHSGKDTFLDYVSQVSAAADSLFRGTNQGDLDLGNSEG